MPYESLQVLLDRWHSGDQAAATEIYDRYQERIAQRARRRLGPLLRTKVQPESIMLLVLESVLEGIAQGNYAAENSGEFLNLLDQITENKIRNKWEFHIAQKRNIQREVRLDGVLEANEPARRQDSPENAAILADELEKIRLRMKPQLFQVFQLLWEGCSLEEIADQLGVYYTTVWRRANRIQELLHLWSGDGKMD
jgi:DNA-directed RNA polymerase specialized sigma24 family protein